MIIREKFAWILVGLFFVGCLFLGGWKGYDWAVDQYWRGAKDVNFFLECRRYSPSFEDIQAMHDNETADCKDVAAVTKSTPPGVLLDKDYVKGGE